MLLLTIVLLSAAIPLIHLPLPIQLPLRVELLTAFAPAETSGKVISPANSGLTEVASTEIPSAPTATGSKVGPSIPQLLFYSYLTGCLVALLMLVRGLFSVLLLTRKARSIPMEGFRLLVTEQEMPAFSFGRWVVLSQSDYDHHRLPLLAHEQAHIRLYHFYDLLMLETVKIVHWFNPLIYLMAKDLKEIHEFQADDYTLTNGIDVTQYQLLIIQKGVGSQRFALANSFNHCQIKKRIVMMNKQKTSKAGSWKVATFLPLLALLLMAFGKSGENPPESKRTTNLIIQRQPEIQPVKEGITNEQLTEYKVSDQTKIDTKGQVIKSNGQPMPGASVLLKGSTIGTITDQEGKFELKGIPSDGELVILHAGYKNKVMKATDKMMRITMEDGKSTPPPPPPPPPVSAFLPKDLDKSTLFVLDGKVIEKSKMEAIKLSEIETVSVLKNKSATDLYGEKAVNGVVQITSKSSSTGVIGYISPQKNSDGIYIVAEQMPQFPGGDALLRNFVAEKIQYPEDARKDKVEGRVFVTFVVNSKGKVVSAKIAKGVDPSLDAEAIRVASLIPDWIPGRVHGEAVDVYYTIPVLFSLQPKIVSPLASNKDPVYLVVEEMPEFPGGVKAMRKFIIEHLNYPLQPQMDKAKGECVVAFVVRSDGKVENAKVVHGINPELDKEAIRVVSMLPVWKPGKKEGKPVNVACTVPINFVLK
jgi:TonB family protein